MSNRVVTGRGPPYLPQAVSWRSDRPQTIPRPYYLLQKVHVGRQNLSRLPTCPFVRNPALAEPPNVFPYEGFVLPRQPQLANKDELFVTGGSRGAPMTAAEEVNDAIFDEHELCNPPVLDVLRDEEEED